VEQRSAGQAGYGSVEKSPEEPGTDPNYVGVSVLERRHAARWMRRVAGDAEGRRLREFATALGYARSAPFWD
jgi:hypothetical protein